MRVEKKSASNLDARPRRSALYMPGANSRALEKARGLNADVLILDLEDAVSPESKEVARQQVCHAVAQGGYGPREIVIRVNGLDTHWGAADIAAANQAMPDAILVPKIYSAADVEAAQEQLADGIALWVMIETPAAIFNLASISAQAASTSLAGFVMGTNDLLKDMRALAMPARDNLLSILSSSVLAARKDRIFIIDGVFNDLDDAHGLQSECEQGRAFGFDGKTLIHPSQLEAANQSFGPSEADVELAQQIVDAFLDPANAGKGVLRVNGKMTEILHKEVAERLLKVHAEIMAKQDAVS